MRAYFGSAMLRQLLALLALLTGLAATSANAEARVPAACGAEQSVAQGAVAAFVQSVAAQEDREPEGIGGDPVGVSMLPAAFAVAAPAVRIGPDRARE